MSTIEKIGQLIIQGLLGIIFYLAAAENAKSLEEAHAKVRKQVDRKAAKKKLKEIKKAR
jgi:anthranilate phosphoribosyltransferase